MSEKEKIYCSNCKEQSDDIELNVKTNILKI